VRLDVGGTGQAIVGRLLPPEDFHARVPWNFALVNLEIDGKSPLYTADPATVIPGVKERIAANLGQSLRFTATVANDGRFRIDDVPAGDYLLSAYVEKRDQNPGSISNYHLRVLPVDPKSPATPIDLGPLQLK
jgi:hypothetical protein